MIRAFLDYAASFFKFAGSKATVAFVLVFIGALLDGFGLIMLVPFLEVFAGGEQSSWSQWFTDGLAQFGVISKQAQLLTAMAGFIVILVLRNVLTWLREVRIRALSLGFVDQWRVDTFSAIARAPWAKVMEYQRTDLEHAINSDVSRLSVGTDQIIRGSIVVVMMVVQVGVAFALSPALTAIVLGFMAVSGLFLLPTISKSRELGDFSTKAGRGMHRVLGQFMSGLKLAKTHDAERGFLGQFTDTVREAREYGLKFSSEQILSRSIFQVVSGVVVCVVILIGLFVLETPVPRLVVVLIIMGRLTGPFLTLVQSAQSFANMLPAYLALKRIHQNLEELVEPYRLDDPSQKSVVSLEPARVELQNIEFQHLGGDVPVLRDVSFTLEPGEITALLGPSGSGKTTLVDIVTGLLRPDSGQLIFDGEVVEQSGPGRAWRAGLSYVPQDSFLFDMPLRENLFWPNRVEDTDVSDGDIWEALELAGAAQFVRDTPGQLDARAGERGQAFSGGERQRLCLARALIRKPRLLVLDEATNAVDMALESELLKRLEDLRGRMTILLITHRHSSVERADHVLTIKNGEVNSER